jgi:hypothetical protein
MRELLVWKDELCTLVHADIAPYITSTPLQSLDYISRYTLECSRK